MGLGLVFPAPRLPPATGGAGINVALYGGIVDRVRRGAPYEATAVTLQRAGGFPLRPFVTVRPPWLAWFEARLPSLVAAALALRLLAAAALVAWAVRLARLGGPLPWWGAALVLLYASVGWAFNRQDLALYHETWAGLLIILSLALRHERRFAVSVTLGLLAALIRELAMPYLLVMGAAALIERRRTEAAAFAAALAVALAALAVHAWRVTALTGPTDLASSGWLKLGGWPFLMATGQWNLLAVVGGAAVAAAILPLALLGGAGRSDGLGLRLTALIGGYSAGFLFVGRPHDTAWGFITAPLIGVGLALAPMALADLARALLGRRLSRGPTPAT